MTTLHLVPPDLQERYHVKEWRNAAGVLSTACPTEWQDVQDVLRGFRLLKSEVLVGGGNRSLISQRIDEALPEGASMDELAEASGSSTFKGSGNISRKDKITLRVAATVIERLPNGVLRIEGTQEVRVNYEVRVLTVSGFVRPSDIGRKNEIAYDRIAGARISYGGRGQISDVQQPRYGQQMADILLPY